MPGIFCKVGVCRNNRVKIRKYGLNIQFHKFPKDPELCKQWIEKCNYKKEFNPNTAFICSVHFDKCDYRRDFRPELMNIKVRRILKPNVIPSLYLDEPYDWYSKKQEEHGNVVQHNKTDINGDDNVQIVIVDEDDDDEYPTNYDDLLKKYKQIIDDNHELNEQLQKQDNLIVEYEENIKQLRNEIDNLKKQNNNNRKRKRK